MKPLFLVILFAASHSVLRPETFELTEVELQVSSPDDQRWSGATEGSPDSPRGFGFMLSREGKSKALTIVVRRTGIRPNEKIALTTEEEREFRGAGVAIESRSEGSLANSRTLKLWVRTTDGPDGGKGLIHVFQIQALRYHVIAWIHGANEWPDEDLEMQKILQSIKRLQKPRQTLKPTSATFPVPMAPKA